MCAGPVREAIPARRERARPLARAACAALLGAAALALPECGSRQETRLARRVLESYRRAAGVKPLPASGVIRIKLSPVDGGPSEGTAQIEWDETRYRETFSSAGLTTVRGIQGGKAYFTDEDGVTRVASEPVLSEMTTRSYFWRRAYLFDDLEKAKIGLGSAGAGTIAVALTPRGGNTLRLTFTRDAKRLERAASPGFTVSFIDRNRFRDESRPERAVLGEIRWTGLLSAALEDATAGGSRARWDAPDAEVSLSREGHGAFFEARLAGSPVKVVLDARADGPIRISAELARALGIALERDVYGRRIARGAVLELPGVAYANVAVEESDSISSTAGAAAGAVFFRETVVELEGGSGRLRLHDPARWVPPQGLFRAVLDDDGNRPVAVLAKGHESFRVRAGVPSEKTLVLASRTARRLGLERPGGALTGVRWGALHLPPLDAAVEDRGFDPEWGDDGTLALDLLLRARTFVDMPHRWIYLAGPSPR